MDGNINIAEIKSEYKKIDLKWLKLHFKTAVGLVLFAFLLECILGFVLFHMGNTEISLQKYVIKYILVPLGANTLFVLIGYDAMNSDKFGLKAKEYFVSLLFVAICFVFYTVHCVFVSLFLIFTVPILLTVVYGDYWLTTVTAFFGISGKIISELFITWDPDKIGVFKINYGGANFIISIFIMVAFYAVCIVAICFEREKSAASIQKEIERYHMQQRLETDELTEIGNRTALRIAFQNMVEEVSENTFIFAMIDIDNFKMLNDTYGHDKGDKCLKDFGRILETDCKDSIPFRFGGDEFCILFKNLSMEASVEICEKIQLDFKEASHKELNMPLTASFGIARYSSEMSPAQLLEISDSALYQSKTVKDYIYIFDDRHVGTVV